MHLNQWGISNYTPIQLKNVFAECDKQGVPKPYLYQGMYHPLCRKLEEEVVPILRQHGTKYYAYR
jgi:aflatoxin B1 aldehyde reductase